MSYKKYLSNLENIGNKKVIITGATAGIGLTLVKTLLLKGATNLVLLARNKEKATNVINELKDSYPDASISFIYYDQSKHNVIDDAVKEIKDNHLDAYAIICNAGILYPPKGSTSFQGYPLTIDTNFIGLAYFIKKLLDILDKPVKFILQGSCVAGFKVKEDIDILDNNIKLFEQYNISKSGVESIFYHYASLNTKHQFILTEPGITATDLFNGFNAFLRIAGKIFIKFFSHSQKKACLTLYKGLEENTKNNAYIVPRGIATFMGLPKAKEFPKKRQRIFLFEKAKKLI